MQFSFHPSVAVRHQTSLCFFGKSLVSFLSISVSFLSVMRASLILNINLTYFSSTEVRVTSSGNAVSFWVTLRDVFLFDQRGGKLDPVFFSLVWLFNLKHILVCHS